MQTRQKFKEAFDIHLAAVIERAEKQAILAKHARRLLNILDDTPVVPGDSRQEYESAAEARGVLNDAEADLRVWEPSYEPVSTNTTGVDTTVMPRDTAPDKREGEASGRTEGREEAEQNTRNGEAEGTEEYNQ